MGKKSRSWWMVTSTDFWRLGGLAVVSSDGQMVHQCSRLRMIAQRTLCLCSVYPCSC